MLQEGGLDPTIRVREAIELYGAAYPNPRPAQELLELVGLGDRGDVQGGRPLRRPAPPARPRARPRRRPRADLPRRADDGLRPRRAPPVVGGDRQPALARQVDPAHHALHGGGAAASPTASSCSPSGRVVAEGTPDELGRDDATSIVSFRVPAFHDGLPLPDGASVERGVVQFRTATPTARPRAAARAGPPTRGMELEHLTVSRPTLEDVYLDLTADRGGRRMTALTADLPLAARWISGRMRMTLRNPRALVFTFAFPLILVVLFSALNGNAEVDAYGAAHPLRPVLHAGDRDLQPGRPRATRR